MGFCLGQPLPDGRFLHRSPRGHFDIFSETMSGRSEQIIVAVIETSCKKNDILGLGMILSSGPRGESGGRCGGTISWDGES